MDQSTAIPPGGISADANAAVGLSRGAGSPDGPGSVQFKPSNIAHRVVARWTGLEAEVVEMVRREPYECQHQSSCHLLVMTERAERDDGESLIDGLPRSTRRDYSGRLSFVPRGLRFAGWHKPRVLTRATYFYIDPQAPLLDPDLRFAEIEFAPRLYFRDQELWEISSKLKAQTENPASGQQQYAEALGILLGHELLRLNNSSAWKAGYARGGLAASQKTHVADYVEANLAETLLLSQLAEVARLSPFHFSRAFKQSFGLPPLRYVTSRRIERAKTLLAGDASITQVAFTVGFAETSSFTVAFRRHTGVTPSAFRRGLG